MEVLGRCAFDIVSLSSSAVSSTSFTSLGGNGTVSLWDTRLKRKNFISIENPNKRAASEATEVLYAANENKVITLCGSTIQLFDVRHTLGMLTEVVRTKEVVQFLSGFHPPGARTTLVVDEDGVITALDVTNIQMGCKVEQHILGQELTVPEGGFGALSNYSCGLGVVRCGSSPNASKALFSIGMDGLGQLFTNTTDPEAFALTDDMNLTGPQVVNPPLPNCCAFRDSNRMAVGRCDGTYTIAEVDGTTVCEVLRAPGHATNCLSFVDFAEDMSLLTLSQCGQICLWDVDAFLQDEGADDDLPQLRNALDHRECTASTTGLVNCAVRLASGSYAIGDTEGYVTMSNVA